MARCAMQKGVSPSLFRVYIEYRGWCSPGIYGDFFHKPWHKDSLSNNPDSIESKRVLVGGSGGFTEIQNKRFLLGLAEMIEIKIHLVGMLWAPPASWFIPCLLCQSRDNSWILTCIKWIHSPKGSWFCCEFIVSAATRAHMSHQFWQKTYKNDEVTKAGWHETKLGGGFKLFFQTGWNHQLESLSPEKWWEDDPFSLGFANFSELLLLNFWGGSSFSSDFYIINIDIKFLWNYIFIYISLLVYHFFHRDF